MPDPSWYLVKDTSSHSFAADPADLLPTPVLSTILKMIDIPTRVISVRAVSQKWRAALLQHSTWYDVDMKLSYLLPPGRSFEKLEPAQKHEKHAGVHVFLNLLRAHPDQCIPASIEFDTPEVWSNAASFAAALQPVKHVSKLVMQVDQVGADALEQTLGEFDNLRELTLQLGSSWWVC